MVRIGFIGCHEISFQCLKIICNLSNKYDDDIVIVFDLHESESSKNSASANLEPLSKKFGFPFRNYDIVFCKINFCSRTFAQSHCKFKIRFGNYFFWNFFYHFIAQFRWRWNFCSFSKPL